MGYQLRRWSASARWHHLDARRYHIFEHLSRKELTRETLHSSLVSDELTKRKLGSKLRTGARAQAGRNSQYKLGARSFTWPRVSHRSFLQKTQFSTSKLPKFTTAWAYLTQMLARLQSVLTIRRFRLRPGAGLETIERELRKDEGEPVLVGELFKPGREYRTKNRRR